MSTLNTKKITCLIILISLLVTSVASIPAQPIKEQKNNASSTLASDNKINAYEGDLDPLVDLAVTVNITHIRALDTIDPLSDPDFYVKVYINGNEFTSPIWHNTKYVDQYWTVTQDVPDNIENVDIKIQLWDWNPGRDKLCDISNNYQTTPTENHDLELVYNLKTGHWRGDDYLNPSSSSPDPSGYGRANGCDDNSIYSKDRDCEIWFDIYQNDYDDDGIPYWTEVNMFGTNPEIDDRGSDPDHDGVPTEWEYKWGYYQHYNFINHTWENKWIYDPFIWDDHANLDPDNDGLDNIEEYLTSQWGSDPFRKDIFLELDQMEKGPNGEGSTVPELSKNMLKEAFSKHNIVFHIDDGCMGGGEMIPFDENTTDEEIQQLYMHYFLHNDTNNWRQGVFHYGLIIYHSAKYPGFVFWGGDDHILDSFQISTKTHDAIPWKFPIVNGLIYKTYNREYQRAVIYAGAMMHETGHTLGIFASNTPGCDDPNSKFPWQINWWKWRPYKSCMNYRYVYQLVDYSDGSRGKNDFNDWARIDLTFFQRPLW